MQDPLHATTRQWNHSWWQILVVLPWCIGLVLLVRGAVEDRQIAKRQMTALGRITSHEPAEHNRYGYIFSANGQQYTGWEIPVADRVIGQPVLVYYDPLNPSRNALIGFEQVAEENRGLIRFMAVGTVVVPAVVYYRRRQSQTSTES